MTENNGAKKKNEKPNNYVKTFRRGSIAANVFLRTAPGGFEYLDFCLSRAWKSTAEKEGYSQNFFSRNQRALHDVIDQACEFIDKAGQARSEEAQTQVA
jgi:hypothetical protein